MPRENLSNCPLWRNKDSLNPYHIMLCYLMTAKSIPLPKTKIKKREKNVNFLIIKNYLWSMESSCHCSELKKEKKTRSLTFDMPSIVIISLGEERCNLRVNTHSDVINRTEFIKQLTSRKCQNGEEICLAKRFVITLQSNRKLKYLIDIELTRWPTLIGPFVIDWTLNVSQRFRQNNR